MSEQQNNEQQGTVKVTLTKDELDRMTPSEFTSLLLRATKIEATAVVRRADGSIKYDDPSRAGSYGEEHLRAEEKGDGPAEV